MQNTSLKNIEKLENWIMEYFVLENNKYENVQNIFVYSIVFQNLSKIENLSKSYKKSVKISKWKSAVKVFELYWNCYDLKNAKNWFTINICFALLRITITNLENWAGMVMCPFN